MTEEKKDLTEAVELIHVLPGVDKNVLLFYMYGMQAQLLISQQLETQQSTA